MEAGVIICGGRKFEIVDHIPMGYEIWNVDAYLSDGYLPICRLSSYQRFPGGRQIDVDSLKAVPTNQASLLLEAASFGCSTLEKMEQFIQNNSKAKPGSVAYTDLQICKKALPIMQSLCKSHNK